MQRMLVLMIGLVLFVGVQPILAQGQNAERAEKIAEARKKNAALLRQYSWTSRTELKEDGKVRDIRVELVNYGPNGQLQCTPLNEQGASMPRGFLRRHVAEEKKHKTQEYLTGLRSLLDQYTLPTTGKVLDFIDRAQVRLPGPGGLVLLTGNNVVNPGDSMSLWVDAGTHQTRKVEIKSTYKGDPVTVTATFKALPGGPTHLEYAEVEVPAKNMSLQVHNFNYTRSE